MVSLKGHVYVLSESGLAHLSRALKRHAASPCADRAAAFKQARPTRTYLGAFERLPGRRPTRTCSANLLGPLTPQALGALKLELIGPEAQLSLPAGRAWAATPSQLAAAARGPRCAGVLRSLRSIAVAYDAVGGDLGTISATVAEVALNADALVSVAHAAAAAEAAPPPAPPHATPRRRGQLTPPLLTSSNLASRTPATTPSSCSSLSSSRASSTVVAPPSSRRFSAEHAHRMPDHSAQHHSRSAPRRAPRNSGAPMVNGHAAPYG